MSWQTVLVSRRSPGVRPRPSTKAVPPSSRIQSTRGGTPNRTSARPATPRVATLLAAAVTAALEPLEGRAMMSATYYVSPTGNDANSGTSTSAPWKSIAKVNAESLHAGDDVLFQGGQTFGGNLKKTSGTGTASAPITFGSYGSGRATLSAGTGNGIYLYNVGGYTIENLIVAGRTGGANQDGMRLEANSALAPDHRHQLRRERVLLGRHPRAQRQVRGPASPRRTSPTTRSTTTSSPASTPAPCPRT